MRARSAITVSALFALMVASFTLGCDRDHSPEKAIKLFRAHIHGVTRDEATRTDFITSIDTQALRQRGVTCKATKSEDSKTGYKGVVVEFFCQDRLLARWVTPAQNVSLLADEISFWTTVYKGPEANKNEPSPLLNEVIVFFDKQGTVIAAYPP